MVGTGADMHFLNLRIYEYFHVRILSIFLFFCISNFFFQKKYDFKKKGSGLESMSTVRTFLQIKKYIIDF